MIKNDISKQNYKNFEKAIALYRLAVSYTYL